MSSGKKAMPPAQQHQYSLYNAKIKRARQVKLDGVPAFSETKNPTTGEVFTKVDIAAKMRRVNAYLKSHDREYWDSHFSVQENRPSKKAVAGPSVPKERPPKEAGKSVTYWEVYPSQTRMTEVFSGDQTESYHVQVGFDHFDQTKEISKIYLEICVDGDTADAIVGHVAVLDMDAEDTTITDGVFFGSGRTCELVTGRRFFRVDVSPGSTLKSTLERRQIVIKRKSVNQPILLRRWVEYTIPQSAPDLRTVTVVGLASLEI